MLAKGRGLDVRLRANDVNGRFLESEQKEKQGPTLFTNDNRRLHEHARNRYGMVGPGAPPILLPNRRSKSIQRWVAVDRGQVENFESVDYVKQ